MSPHGRGLCVVCERGFALTYAGTIPAHTARSTAARSRLRKHCAGSDQPPKAGTVTAR